LDRADGVPQQAEALPRFDHAFRDWLHGLTPPAFERRSEEAADDEQRIEQRGSPLPPSGRSR